jgi:hypothetical protein
VHKPLALLASLFLFGGCGAPPVARAPEKPSAAPPPATAPEAPSAAPIAIAAPRIPVCHEGEPENDAAWLKLKEIRAQMKKQGASAFAEVVPKIHALLTSPCYRRLAFEPVVHLDFDGPESLEAWWGAGAAAWLESFLSQPPDGAARDNRNRLDIFVGPDARRILNSKAVSAPDASPTRRALSFVVCPDSEVGCGAATAGWLQRATDAFELEGYQNGYFELWRSDAAKEPLPTRLSCESRALAAPEGERLRVFRTCVEAVQLHVWAPPLGRFRAPDSGWLIVRGRRGHYEFCDELSAYDLTSGAAYRAKSCSGLLFGNDGMVDDKQVDAARKPRVEIGNLSTDNLRELALMMLLAPEAERDLVLDSRWFEVPAGIDAGFSDGPRIERYATAESHSSAQTSLTWTLARGDKPAGSPGGLRATNQGSFLWPGSWNVADNYVGRLLRVTESGFVAGCPRAALAPGITHIGPEAQVSPIDAGEASVDETAKALEGALAQAKAPSRCKKKGL